MARVSLRPSRTFTKVTHTDGSSIAFESTRLEYNDAIYTSVVQSDTVEEFLIGDRILRALSLVTEELLKLAEEQKLEEQRSETVNKTDTPLVRR